ncbi:hypothetical protein CRYUN_Cryun05aG0211600 [Craigia yunnanensis]
MTRTTRTRRVRTRKSRYRTGSRSGSRSHRGNHSSSTARFSCLLAIADSLFRTPTLASLSLDLKLMRSLSSPSTPPLSLRTQLVGIWLHLLVENMLQDPCLLSWRMVLEFKKGRLQNLYWKRDGCAQCSGKSNFVCLSKQD